MTREDEGGRGQKLAGPLAQRTLAVGTRAEGRGREDFLVRVRAALNRHGREHVPEPPPLEEKLVRRVSAEEDLVARFAERAAGAGVKVVRTAMRALPAELGALLEELEARRVTVSLSESPLAAQVHAGLAAARRTVVDWRAEQGLEAHYDVDAGITDVVAAIAETGSLVMAADAQHSRGTHLVPPAHVAVVRASDIVPDLIDIFRRLREAGQGMSASTVIVTGPSKTADIEGILITGVHGPGRVAVLLVEDS
ncbi:MAG: LUD domain-containing protein [Planctomycetota bacterium]